MVKMVDGSYITTFSDWGTIKIENKKVIMVATPPSLNPSNLSIG